MKIPKRRLQIELIQKCMKVNLNKLIKKQNKTIKRKTINNKISNNLDKLNKFK